VLRALTQPTNINILIILNMLSPVKILFLFTLLLIPLKFWLPASTIENISENISNQISSLGQPNIQLTPIELDIIPVAYRHFDLVVYGDELPGICAAIWARKTLGPDHKIALVRQQDESALFGGLLTRGGLSYLDFDKTPYWAEQPYSQCFQEFMKRSEIAEACVEPVKASRAIAQMLEEANITILHGVTLQPKVENAKIKYVKVDDSHQVNSQKDLRIKSEIYIDATQNAELAQKAGVKYDIGYASQNPQLSQETLAVSIVPVIEGLTIDELKNIEYEVLDNYTLMDEIEASIRANQPPKAADFWLFNFTAPIFQRYIDGYYQKSIALGGAYHLWRKQPFQKTNFLFDKGNICEQKPQSLSWNGFLFKYSTDQVLQLEKDNLRPNAVMVQEMQQLEQWFSQLAGKPVKVVIPPEIYVRHSLSMSDVVDPLTGQEILQGGTVPNNSIGTFSYEFDFRGGIKGIGIKNPPLPIYNFGIENTLAKNISNLAIVSRSAGYQGIGVSVGRILTVKIYQGQALGVAAALAIQSKSPFHQMRSLPVRQKLEELTGLTTYLQGLDTRNGIDFSEIR
jgi:hypothetical protein